MAWVSPKKTLGVTTVAAGTSVKRSPTPLPHDFGWVVAVQLTETAFKRDLKKKVTAPPDTTGWEKVKLKNDIGFTIDQRARGEIIQELNNGEVVVDFKFVAAIVGDADIE